MKSLLTYSGKGGVGKSTITYCMYKALKESGVNVLVLDMDLNTPSMHNLMGDQDLISNYKSNTMFLDKATVSMFLKTTIKDIRAGDPDVLLIDTPPSITDVHLALIDKLNLSGAVLVSQPTTLSKSDVERTVPFFQSKGVTVVGIVENMVNDEGLEYDYDKLCSVPLADKLDSGGVYSKNKKLFKSLVDGIMATDLAEVAQENKVRSIFNETVSWEDVQKMYGFRFEDGEFDWLRRNGKISDLKFVNLATWPMLYEAIEDANWGAHKLIGYHKKDVVSEATPERVERLVKAFESDQTALFIVTKNPHTEIPTLCGEVGTCVLKIDDKFSGIPTVEYRTEQGSIRMFPHEVMPVTEKVMADTLADGAYYIEGGKRLIPTFDVCCQIAGTFGKLAGMPEDYDALKSLYEKVSGTKIKEEVAS